MPFFNNQKHTCDIFMIYGAFLKNTGLKIVRGKPKIVFFGTIKTFGQDIKQ